MIFSSKSQYGIERREMPFIHVEISIWRFSLFFIHNSTVPYHYTVRRTHICIIYALLKTKESKLKSILFYSSRIQNALQRAEFAESQIILTGDKFAFWAHVYYVTGDFNESIWLNSFSFIPKHGLRCPLPIMRVDSEYTYTYYLFLYTLPRVRNRLYIEI